MMREQNEIRYRPIRFILITFGVTWACAFFMAYQSWTDGSTVLGSAILTAVDFLESASPLAAALILLRGFLFQEGGIWSFIFGRKPEAAAYAMTAGLFLLQFLTFYLFRGQPEQPVSITVFLGAWAGQILLGGGMEEGGWRGYLQPAFEKKLPAPAAVVAVSLIWACWHLPYFFLPGTFQSGESFLFYVVTTTATAFTLTAIHKMTGSVLLCTLFHGWQNAIVMNLPADMGHPGFLILFAAQTVVSILLCVKPIGRKR